MFDFHILNEQGKNEVKKFKSTISAAITEIDSLLPQGREKSIFITKLEEAMFFGTRSIASKPENHTEVQSF